MSLSIQTNSASSAIANNLNTTNRNLAVSLERLGTGLRINSAQDDAAGLQIANRLNSQMVGQRTGISNANNAVSMMQTAEGAFDEMTNIVTRMQELATQSANGVNNGGDREALQAEYGNLGAELRSILENTTYGRGTQLLDADDGRFMNQITFQVGASEGETLEVNIGQQLQTIHNVAASNSAVAGLDTLIETYESAQQVVDNTTLGSTEGQAAEAVRNTARTALTTAIETYANGTGGASDPDHPALAALLERFTDAATNNTRTTSGSAVTPTAATEAAEAAAFEALSAELENHNTSGLGNLNTQDSSRTAMTAMANLIDTLGTARSSLGANINRLGSTINNLSNMAEASESAYGQIMDADFAEESANRSRNQLLLQSGVSVLSASNSTSQVISQLLR